MLKDCHARIEAGESVAIAGPSGHGKTTLAKALLRITRLLIAHRVVTVD